MTNGKIICNFLKSIRKQIADANEIPYEIEECSFQGECPGTCPKCDAETAMLQQAIDDRKQQGKEVHYDVWGEDALKNSADFREAIEELCSHDVPYRGRMADIDIFLPPLDDENESEQSDDDLQVLQGDIELPMDEKEEDFRERALLTGASIMRPAVPLPLGNFESIIEKLSGGFKEENESNNLPL